VGPLLLALAILAAPEGWRKESFTFPLGFAPSIAYEGTEHVRFAPGWERFDTDEGFSYVYVWDVKAKPVTPEDIEDHLEAYFNGLMSNVSRGRKLENAPPKAAAAVHPMTAVPGWTQAYGAELRTGNAFSKNEPLLLYGEVTQRNCGAERMQIFFAMSKSPRDRPIWEGLRAIRTATPCEAKLS
jgi:hypothetical protein